MSDFFRTRNPSIRENRLLRLPQRESFIALQDFAASDPVEREAGIVLPVGCGKSGCIALAPFAFQADRTLIIAPGLRIAEQASQEFRSDTARDVLPESAGSRRAPVSRTR